jgi:hypothetical protein
MTLKETARRSFTVSAKVLAKEMREIRPANPRQRNKQRRKLAAKKSTKKPTKKLQPPQVLRALGVRASESANEDSDISESSDSEDEQSFPPNQQVDENSSYLSKKFRQDQGH